MAEYIKRESLIKHLKQFAPEQYSELINQLILKEPAADVAPVVHGHWLPCNDDDKKRCSRCDVICLIGIYPAWNTALFCPCCGAKMDGKDGEQE